MELERTIKTSKDHRIDVCNWDEEGVWLRMSNRYGSLHTTLTKDEALELYRGLRIAMGLCPDCESDSWSTVREGNEEYCECHCGCMWGMK